MTPFLTPSTRIVELERRLQEAEDRIARLIETFNNHTHRYIVERQESSCYCCSAKDLYDDTYSPEIKV